MKTQAAIAAMLVAAAAAGVDAFATAGGFVTGDAAHALRLQVTQQQPPRSTGVGGAGLVMRVQSKKGKRGVPMKTVSRASRMRDRLKVAKTPTKVYVSNLSWSATADQVRELCSQFGEVCAVKMIRDQYTNKFKGYAFVDFKTALEAQVAVEELPGTVFMDRPVMARPAYKKTAEKYYVDIENALAKERQEMIENDTEQENKEGQKDEGAGTE